MPKVRIFLLSKKQQAKKSHKLQHLATQDESYLEEGESLRCHVKCHVCYFCWWCLSNKVNFMGHENQGDFGIDCFG